MSLTAYVYDAFTPPLRVVWHRPDFSREIVGRTLVDAETQRPLRRVIAVPGLKSFLHNIYGCWLGCIHVRFFVVDPPPACRFANVESSNLERLKEPMSEEGLSGLSVVYNNILTDVDFRETPWKYRSLLI